MPKQFKQTPKFETGATKRQQEVPKLLEHCQWFIINKISMVSAQLLADLEQKMRCMMKDIESKPPKKMGDKESAYSGG